MFCQKCGKQLNTGTKFCTGCGAPVGAAANNAGSNGQIPPSAPSPAAPPASGPAAPAAPRPAAPAAPRPAAPAASAAPLNYKIFGDNLPAVSIRLEAGQSIYTQSGGMTWMDRGINMETNMKGGLMKGLGRMFSGESLFMATYTATMPNQEIVFASTFPGYIVGVDVGGCPIIAQKNSFLCAQPTVTLSAYVTKGIKAGFFGGEGFVMQRLTGQGMVFFEVDGSLVEKTLAPGEVIKVDTGNVAAFEETVQYQAEMVKGFKNILFGGEGLFLTTLTGPGKVWLQTMSMSEFAKNIIPFIPTKSN